ncbi:hypothetical protein BK120_10030 [Paenibacillus sp. FSL A5-0031]|uniref:hypothetical protein n=1 Tax=Paenibacillus sp. FSL A5-0031 TaxID=1920420 RepID=UPI00096EF4BF|nr:hypothetical protein [Paenibacillus sp. FSL A5-0031]OME86284.1 hypothetical protein BK120_10030 [Paenibacillus sp. FSL A5-0031]
MNQRWSVKRTVVSFSLFILIALVLSVIIWYRITDPLVNNGLQRINNHDGKVEEYVVELSNEGFQKIDIKKVSVNGEDRSDDVQLGISYDSTHMVQVLPSLDPATQFMELSASSIYPALSRGEIQAALERKEHTPMQYGLRIRYEHQPIQNVTITYKYLGFTKTKSITNWFESDSLQ